MSIRSRSIKNSADIRSVIVSSHHAKAGVALVHSRSWARAPRDGTTGAEPVSGREPVRRTGESHAGGRSLSGRGSAGKAAPAVGGSRSGGAQETGWSGRSMRSPRIWGWLHGSIWFRSLLITGKPRLLDASPGVSLAVRLAVHFEVALRERSSTVEASEATNVILDLEFVLKILSFDALLTAAAQASVELVVVLLAIRLVLVDVELGRGERLGTGGAYKAGLVVFACQSAICR